MWRFFNETKEKILFTNFYICDNIDVNYRNFIQKLFFLMGRIYFDLPEFQQ